MGFKIIYEPKVNKKVTAAASQYSPVIIAPMAAKDTIVSMPSIFIFKVL